MDRPHASPERDTSAATGPARGLAALFGMTDTVWERHANPWSGWSRVPILPLMTAAIWWRDALDGLFWPTIAALVLWTWINPRVFPPPATTANWMSKAVMGERVWLNRKRVPVPRHYHRALPIITGFSLAGLPLIGLGLLFEDAWPLLLGLVLSLLGKFWFLDRMVWLYDDMSRTHPIYASWMR